MAAKYREVKKLGVADAAYIAGMIDGEGSILLTRRHKNENRQLVISISNNDKPLLDYIRTQTGVGIITRKNANCERYSVNYTYKVSNRQALGLLRQIHKFLKSYKKRRAKLVLNKYLKLTPRNGKYTEKLQSEREIFISDFFNIRP